MWSEECPHMTSLHTSHLQFVGDMSRECQVSTINLVWKQKIAMHCVASLSYVAHHIHYSSHSSWLFPKALCQNSYFQVYLWVTLLAVSFFSDLHYHFVLCIAHFLLSSFVGNSFWATNLTICLGCGLVSKSSWEKTQN